VADDFRFSALLYMAPEILRGENATSASDVFSLGAVLYELAAGRHPFAGETPLRCVRSDRMPADTAG